ncbi:MAG: glutamate 5-kinase [Candidatus Planktophila sp.]|nr:glutamate 5-kinase [Candidatus Planktophila sp.]
MNRQAVTEAKRIVLKVGSSSLTGSAGSALDAAAVGKIVDLAASLRARGAEVLIVSSGAIAAGLAPLKLTSRPKDLPTQQAAASVGQGLLIAKYNELFSAHSIVSSQVLLTTEDVVRRSHYNTAQQTLSRLLALGVTPIINENDSVGTAEIRFGDNDRLAALVALLVQADLLVLISDVDALYDAHPSQAGAKAIHEVLNIADIDSVEVGGAGSSGVGSGGMVTKIEAARIATSAGTPMLLTSLAQSADSLAGKEFGTIFHAQAARTNSRLLWLAHASSARGRLILDAGAVTAILEKGVSLLPAGVTAVEGEFSAGDTVELAGKDGKVIARGLVAFDSLEIPQMLGRSTKELAASLGVEYERELVHRDDLVLL